MLSNFKALLLSVFFFNVSAHAEIKRHVIQDVLESGQVEYVVIEENTALRSNQSIISQKVIYKKRGSAHNAEILKEIEQIKQSPAQITFEGPDGNGKPLWVAIKTSWTAQDEKDYSDWFADNASEQFNIGTALLADCADVALLFRWAYAHDKKLPVANTLSGSGKLFGHFTGSSAWDRLPSDPNDWRKDERFKQAMRYLFNNAYTRSIITDLYPTEISPNYVRPGSVYMIIRKDSGHAQTIQKMEQDSAGIYSLWGNEPSAEKIFKSWFIWEPAVKNMFGQWRAITFESGVWKLISATKNAGYSEEQFKQRIDLGEDDFQAWVLDRLGLVDYFEVKLGRLVETVKDGLVYRKNSTALAGVICGLKPCAITSADYDNHSTNSRDARLIQSQDALMKTINDAGGIDDPSVQKAISIVSGLGDILLAGYDYTYRDFIFSPALLKNIKADANLSYNLRWGLEQFPSLDAQFKFYSQQLEITLNDRIELVGNGIYYCILKVCDPLAESIKALNTSKIDQGFKLLANQIRRLLATSEIQPATLQVVFDHYRLLGTANDIAGQLENSFCENPTRCSLYDVVWKDDGLSRVNSWTSQPQDSPISRWGL